MRVSNPPPRPSAQPAFPSTAALGTRFAIAEDASRALMCDGALISELTPPASVPKLLHEVRGAGHHPQAVGYAANDAAVALLQTALISFGRRANGDLLELDRAPAGGNKLGVYRGGTIGITSVSTTTPHPK